MTPKDFLGNARRVDQQITRHTIVMIPAGCHLLLPSTDLGTIPAVARFVRISDEGTITPLPMQNVATTTIPVADSVLAQLDSAYFAQQATKGA